MSRFRAYLQPFDDNGNLTDFVEVTEDVDLQSISDISVKIDNDEYDVGLFNFNSFSVKFRNEHGRYSEVGNSTSIFKFRRAGTPFKLTWQVSDDFTECGIAVAGKSKLTPEVDVLTGVLNDEATRLSISTQQITFRVLTSDSIFSAVETPFGSISVSDLYSDIIFTVLNQTEITDILTIDVANINVGLDLAVDDVAKFENTTVKEALDRLLFQSNSVLYIKDQTVFVSSRDGGAESEKTFTGQGSNKGIEDIVRIEQVSSGLNSTFNFWTWRDTTLKSEDASSITSNGIKKKEISFDEITDSGKRQQVLDAQKTEFANRKQELQLTTFLDYENLALKLLDQVRVDYPTVYYPAEAGGELPIYGVSRYGEANYPESEISITISDLTPFKIMGINIRTKDQTMTFKLKEM